MFCRFCGKAIKDDSVFCPCCGKAQESESENRATPKIEIPKTKKIDTFTLSTIASICFYLGIIVFLILFMKMAPGVGGEQFLSYLKGATLMIVVAVIIDKIRKKSFTKKRQMVALVFGLLLLIPSLTLRIVYESKVDAAVADIPKSGTVCVRVRLDEEFYSYYKSGSVREPYSYISIDGHKFSGTSTFAVELNQAYTTKIGAGYEGEVRVASSSASGSINKTITFTQSNLQNGYSIQEKVPMGSGYAEVTIKFERVCTFWEVIFYRPS